MGGDVCSGLCGKDLGPVTVTDRSRWEGPELNCGWEWGKEEAEGLCEDPREPVLWSSECWGRQRNCSDACVSVTQVGVTECWRN